MKVPYSNNRLSKSTLSHCKNLTTSTIPGMLHYFRMVTILSIFALCVSCKSTSKPAEEHKSDLITKINAVQEQIMAQGNISEQEEQALMSLCSIVSHNDGLANFSPDERMILKDVDFAPVYEGCEGLSAEKTMECFKNKVSTFIKREFNLNISQDLNLTEPKQVDVFFIIDHEGNLTGMKVRDSEVTIQAEILRVLRKIPVMQPATHQGKDVSVLCSLQLKYGNELDVDVVYIPERPEN